MGKKKRVQVAIEIEYPETGTKVKVKRAYAVTISDYTSKSLGKGIEQMIDSEAVVTTDGWPAYPKAVSERWHDIFTSDQGESFKQLHWQIFNLKNWLRGVHHSVSLNHLNDYLAEFYYRFNRRNFTNHNPRNLIKEMINLVWKPYSALMAN